MLRALACSLFCASTWLVIPACSPCNRSGCDALRTPAADDGESGIAGVIAYESDVVANGCQECPFTSASLSIWAALGPVADGVSAKAIIQAGPPAVSLDADARYRQALAPASYLLCAFPASYSSACVSVDVVAGHATPVNLKLLFGPFHFIVFDPRTRAPVAATMLYPGS